jgi:hypothetical protein
LPRVAAAGWALARDLTTESCAADTVCIPCTGPIHEEFTGVCNPLENPHGIKPCGAWDGGPSGGYCVAQEKVDAWGLPMSPILRQDECIAGEKCVPAAQVEAPRSCSARCTTTLGSFGDQYAPGACVPTYIVRDVNPTGLAILTQGTCAFGEMCAPCLDPLNNGVSSRMCE